MKYDKIVLAGGNGYLGKVLQEYYKPLAREVIVLSRKPSPSFENIRTISWDARTQGEWVECLNHADLLINLCGKNVNCRYTPENKAEIINSRVTPTTLLAHAIQSLAVPPRLWINVTSATIYRHAEDRPQDEDTGEIGYGFSIDVCRKWEEAFFENPTPGTRKVALRMGVVFGKRDGAFPRLLALARLGLGGKQGNGQQYMSWLHEQDAAKCTEWLLQNEAVSGILNCTSPNPAKNEVVMAALRKACGMPVGIPAPAWLLEIGTRVIGTEMELLLKSRWVLPKRLLDHQFEFSYPEIGHAVNDIVWQP
ncbi:hypothetical protein SAMN05216327_107287 [Dyadobacter sp. SG02]|uniref:TIGR01777 family oxidoreductase n=1 Tax=Dyadobacter sp. SG02 TaxID=1855291 RepID=UPI0008ABFAC8|nr:TIGR01777 family oxidoreductase [Dyadobacter sp. SG02]SEJ24065.1 hypothetical protein SAMN05216327_107287 [Dyadobacter sp. SG02]